MEQKQDPSKWHVVPVISGGKEFFRVQMLLGKEVWSVRGGLYESRIDAEKLAGLLNSEGAKP